MTGFLVAIVLLSMAVTSFARTAFNLAHHGFFGTTVLDPAGNKMPRIDPLTAILAAGFLVLSYNYLWATSWARPENLCLLLGLSAMTVYLSWHALHFDRAVLVSQTLVCLSGPVHPNGLFSYSKGIASTLRRSYSLPFLRRIWRRVPVVHHAGPLGIRPAPAQLSPPFCGVPCELCLASSSWCTSRGGSGRR